MKLAPNPTRTRPTQMNTVMLGAHASATSPAAHSRMPMRNVLFHPMVVPMRPPAIMNAPPTRGYTILASWISEVVAWSSCVSAVADSESAPLSPVAPICARMRMIIGMTRNFSLPARDASPCFVLAVDAMEGLLSLGSVVLWARFRFYGRGAWLVAASMRRAG